MLIDTHCHLDAPEFDTDRDTVLHSAQHAGVSAIIIPAVAPTNFAAVRDCCQRYPGCYPAYGIHPLYVAQAGANGLIHTREWLRDELASPTPPLAVGEIGLDFYVPGTDAASQELFFVEQLKIAREFDLPVLLHVRRAVDHVLKCLRKTGLRRGIAHAFNGSRQQADEFIRLGFKLGFGGAMTFPGSTRIRRLAAELPIESIVLETDAPDMPPCWLDRQRNSPVELAKIAETLAELRQTSLSEIAEATSRTSRTLFGISA
ncbi:TatD family hydrolase [Propionivibrio limicola]|uniref:TatD family hydrolase n=1 Tax=Propionivibrio limicola TaxID=167645 RepID=UPI001291C34E|nr:TatD family hydrolase [Propionivibrio limicola]